MKRFSFLIAAALAASCQNNPSPDQVVSRAYIHKYGFGLSESQWEERAQEGQIVEMLQNGVTLTRTYENGTLHGIATSTFPNSSVVEKIQLYDQGNLLKETIQDKQGMPIREEAYEFDERMILTHWNEKGIPLSIEEYNGELLVEGKYFSPEHELEAEVENGNGYRTKRERTGLLISKDKIENGIMSARTTFHPNGQIHTISHYNDYMLHGEQKKFTTTGRPLMQLRWNRGVMDGVKTIYRNGLKVAEIPYVSGQKQGTELHYDDLGNLIAEIPWRNDKKHGCAKNYTEDSRDTDWFFNGMAVTSDKFQILCDREMIAADFQEAERAEIIESKY